MNGDWVDEIFTGNPPAPRDVWRGGSSYEASMLRNLLARIHRDGGHYVEQHGLEKALEDADAKVVAWLTRDDALGVPVDRHQGIAPSPTDGGRHD